MAIGKQSPRFVHQAVGQHLLHTTVDPVVQRRAIPQQGVFLDVEIPLGYVTGTIGGKGVACLVADLQGTLQATGILLIDYLPILGIQALDFLLQCYQAAIPEQVVDPLPNLNVNVGHGVNALAYRIDEQTGTARENHLVVLEEELLQQLEYILFILSNIIVV